VEQAAQRVDELEPSSTDAALFGAFSSGGFGGGREWDAAA
jgi:hypothetical protein